MKPEKKQLVVRISDTLKTALERAAADERKTLSEFCRDILTEHLNSRSDDRRLARIEEKLDELLLINKKGISNNGRKEARKS